MQKQISLSKKDLKILFLILREYSNPQIAKILGLSLTGVKKRVQVVFKKFGVKSRVGLTKAYYQNESLWELIENEVA